MPKQAIIIGAGPAGLTAALELLRQTDVEPIVLEATEEIGGISRTVNHNGYRMDIGGHRFFSKSDTVMDWWLDILPMVEGEGPTEITYQRKTRTIDGSGEEAPSVDDRNVMLVRERRSRIYYMRKFFSYPVSLSVETLRNLGLFRSIRIGFSYLRTVVFPSREPTNLEEFFISRFGRELYSTFFKDYTEKVWGTPCNEISAEWGAQRIKGLSITKALVHFVTAPFRRNRTDISQKDSETSLIERFLYPKFGPGQMWEEVARKVEAGGGRVVMQSRVDRIFVDGQRVTGVEAVNDQGERTRYDGDYVVSTMPIRHLTRALQTSVPEDVEEISEGLVYRDFITVGLLLEDLKIRENSKAGEGLVKDNWIYIQEPDVLVGRLQIFNNWSPYLVADPTKVWLGLEYFCNKEDDLWTMDDAELSKLGAIELEKIDIIDPTKVLDSCVIRVPKTYPAYFGTYDRFDDLRGYIDAFENLFLVGRNGMHRYNNQDHSMLTAMAAVSNIASGRIDKDNIWDVNTEDEYHEEK